MKKGYKAATEAIEIAKIVLQSTEFQGPPTADTANSIADFIQTLADRLEPVVEPLQN